MNHVFSQFPTLELQSYWLFFWGSLCKMPQQSPQYPQMMAAQTHVSDLTMTSIAFWKFCHRPRALCSHREIFQSVHLHDIVKSYRPVRSCPLISACGYFVYLGAKNRWSVFSNNLVHIEPHFQAVWRDKPHTIARAGDSTSNCKDTLANYKPGEMRKLQMAWNVSTTTITQRWGCHMCGLTMSSVTPEHDARILGCHMTPLVPSVAGE